MWLPCFRLLLSNINIHIHAISLNSRRIDTLSSTNTDLSEAAPTKQLTVSTAAFAIDRRFRANRFSSDIMDPIISASNVTATHPDSMHRPNHIKFTSEILPYLFMMLVVSGVLVFAYYVGYLYSTIRGTKKNHAVVGALLAILTGTFWIPLTTYMTIQDQTKADGPHASFMTLLFQGGCMGIMTACALSVLILPFMAIQRASQDRKARHSKAKKDEQLEEGGDGDKQLEEGGETEKTASL